MIDFTKPIETTETPPRPVMVLYALGNDTPFGFVLTDGSNLMFSMNDPDAPRLRNFAPEPPKPVRHEAWVNLYGNGIATLQSSRTNADKVADHQERVECRHIVWNSDGSPVESDDLTEAEVELEIAKAERDMWKAQCERADKLRAEIERMKPVVDAALDWRSKYGVRRERASSVLEVAVCTYENQQPATSESHEAMVQDALDPQDHSDTRNHRCSTCKWFRPDIRICNEPTQSCYWITRGSVTFKWEAKS